jgi:hypothetical protein
MFDTQSDSEQRKMCKRRLIAANHLVQSCLPLLGLVPDQELARISGVPVAGYQVLREALGIEPATPEIQTSEQKRIENYPGPWLGYESLFGTMSLAKISRLVGVPFNVVNERHAFLGAASYQRLSRITPYEHLLGIVSDKLLAKLAGVSEGRVGQYRRSRTRALSASALWR